MTINQILETAAWVFGSILFVYLFCRILFDRDVIISNITGDDEVEGDQFYYLPATSITITATASVVVGLNEDKQVKKAELWQISLDAVTKTEPDTNKLVKLQYTEDIFSNDELSIVTTAESLLQNVSSSTEDRITQIIANVAEAPGKILSRPAAFDVKEFSRPGKEEILDEEEFLVFEIREFKRLFIIPAQETRKEIPLKWEILIEGESNRQQSVNASFQLKNPGRKPALTPSKPFAGLYSRRIKNEKWDLHLSEKNTSADQEKFQSKPETSFSCAMVDISSLLKIPVRRALFVKKVQTPKFSHGLLIENSFTKPSQVEAFLSIPINIGKAILSIPAALFQFRITQVKKQTEYENALIELLKAKKQSDDRDDTTDATPDSTLSVVKPVTIERPALRKIPKLAKVEDIIDRVEEREINFREKSRPDAFSDTAAASGLDLPAIPHSWAGQYIKWGTYQNDKLKTCAPAAAANQVLSWTTNANQSQIKQLTDSEVIKAYADITGFNPENGSGDIGCDEEALLNYWIETGIGGSKIERFIHVRPDFEMIRAATYWFGGCLISLNMPDSAKRMGDSWISPSKERKFDLPGSWGRHTVPVLGYGKDSLVVVSCSVPITMTKAFFDKFSRDIYVCLSKDWLKDGKTITKKALTTSELSNAMDTIENNYKL